jgi:hypothetical protein
MVSAFSCFTDRQSTKVLQQCGVGNMSSEKYLWAIKEKINVTATQSAVYLYSSESHFEFIYLVDAPITLVFLG